MDLDEIEFLRAPSEDDINVRVRAHGNHAQVIIGEGNTMSRVLLDERNLAKFILEARKILESIRGIG